MLDPASLVFPAFILALLAALFGVWRKNVWALVASAVLTVPAAMYLAGTSDLSLFAWLIPLALGGAAVAVQKQKTRLAWVLLLPLLLTVLMLILGIAAWASLGS